MVVSPVKQPPAGAVTSDQPFLAPTGLASNADTNQPPSTEKVLPSTSTISPGTHQEPDFEYGSTVDRSLNTYWLYRIGMNCQTKKLVYPVSAVLRGTEPQRDCQGVSGRIWDGIRNLNLASNKGHFFIYRRNLSGRGCRLCQLLHFLLLIAWQPLCRFSSHSGHACSSLWKIFCIWGHDSTTNQRSHMSKNMFLRGICLTV